MAVEIHILSGARSGARIALDQTEFQVGTDSHCEILLDPRSDPSAKDRSVHLRLTDDGWYIRSTGTGEVLLNQTPIVKETQIRSGDLVRLSELGPDFSFVIMSRAAASVRRAGFVPTIAREVSTAVGVNAQFAEETGRVETAAVGPSSPEAPSRPTSGMIKNRWNWSVWAGAAVTLMLLGTGFWYLNDRTMTTEQIAPEPDASLELEAVSVQTATEGSELTLQLHLKRRGTSASQPVFILIGQPPEGAEINRQTGLFRWTPTEEQGPGEHTIRIQVGAGEAQRPRAETAFQVEVREVNSPPTIHPIEEKTIDAGQELVFSVAADDPDQPPGRRTFYLSDGPDWIGVERSSGIVRCMPPATADGRFDATICVSDDGEPPLEDRVEVQLVVHGNPWIRAQKELREALYIVQVEKGGFSWPHATCCGIGGHTLLTTASEAIDLARLQQQGYKIWAVNPFLGSRLTIRAFCVPQAVADLTEPSDWFCANLGLLETEEQLPKKVPLASHNDLQDLEEGEPVACFGFAHDGSKITRFDRFEPRSVAGEIYLIGSSPRLGKKFRLLELKAKIPENMVGSPILNRQGALIGVYGKVAPDEGVGVKDLQYAAIPDPQLLQSWLDGSNVDDWITPRAPEAVTAPRPTSPTEAN
jgi:hypothetical protein